MSTHTDLAWCAGFFDGEGCTMVRRHTRARLDGTRYAYPALHVGQANREPLDRMQRALGIGKVTGPFKPYANSRRDHYKLSLYGLQDVQAAIAMMWPWLTTVKREQAKRVLLAVKAAGPFRRPGNFQFRWQKEAVNA